MAHDLAGQRGEPLFHARRLLAEAGQRAGALVEHPAVPMLGLEQGLALVVGRRIALVAGQGGDPVEAYSAAWPAEAPETPEPEEKPKRKARKLRAKRDKGTS